MAKVVSTGAVVRLVGEYHAKARDAAAEACYMTFRYIKEHVDPNADVRSIRPRAEFVEGDYLAVSTFIIDAVGDGHG